MKVSVIIPCFNEEDNIEECIRKINLPYPYEIIVVDDGSVDKTAERARKIRKKETRVIRYEKNRGKGYALRVGIENSSSDIIVIQDADMATPPEELPNIVKPILDRKADFVNGTRFIYPMESGAMKGAHVLGNKLFSLLVTLLLRQRLTDTLCGFKAFRKRALMNKLKEDSWPDFELLFQAKRNGLKIVEVPIHYKARKTGRSKMKTFRHGFNMFKMLVKNIF
jgi:glycosyltransferase involved in cell wall biosynthesis